MFQLSWGGDGLFLSQFSNLTLLIMWFPDSYTCIAEELVRNAESESVLTRSSSDSYKY